MDRSIWQTCAPALFFVSAHLNAAPDHPEPKPLSDRNWHNLVRYHRDQLTVRRADICLLGDSLTEFWQEHGRQVWTDHFHQWKTVNCGIAADRVEHVLYRTGQLKLSTARPRVLVLLAGTNNLSGDSPDSPEAVVRGCAAVISLIRAASPETKLIVLSLPPNGISPESPLRRNIRETNHLLAKLAESADAEFIDIYPLFVDDHDRWCAGATIDGTHFSPVGYALLATALQPVLERLLNSR